MSDWIKLFDVTTTWNELQGLIREYAEHAIDPDMSETERDEVRAQIRATFEAGWWRLQQEQVSGDDRVH
jgi:hypothetical protein